MVTVGWEDCRRVILVCLSRFLNISELMMSACSESQKGVGTPPRTQMKDRGEIVKLCMGDLPTDRHEPPDSGSNARGETNAHVGPDAAQAHLGISVEIGEVDESAYQPQFGSHFESRQYA